MLSLSTTLATIDRASPNRQARTKKQQDGLRVAPRWLRDWVAIHMSQKNKNKIQSVLYIRNMFYIYNIYIYMRCISIAMYTRHGMTWCGTRHDMAYGMAWHGVVWHGVAWQGAARVLDSVAISAQRTASP